MAETLSLTAVKALNGGGGGGGDATWGNIGGNINDQTDLNNEFVKKSTFLNKIYPTGTILFTYNKVSPATYIGGEWELIEEGYYPVAAIKDMIDEETERLVDPILPKFTGSMSITGNGSSKGWLGGGGVVKVASTGSYYGFNPTSGKSSGLSSGFTIDSSAETDSIYKGEKDEVKPKSILVYFWRRVDNGTLTYNFVNISFSENDFITDPTTGQISLRNAIYYYTPNNIPKADNTGKLIDSGININDIVLKIRKVANIPLDHDITEQEIQDAIKDITAELKNKTINADNNTITNLETDNFKDTALAKSTDNIRDYANSVDTKVATEKFLQKTLLNIETPENNKDAVNKKYVDDEIAKVVATTYTFKGYISTTQPASAKTGNLWYEGATLPTTFPINVKTYDGTTWSATTSEYTPNDLDLWSLIADNHGYYWFGGEWNILDTSTSTVDNITIDRNNQNELEVKDGGITKDKLNSNVADGSTIEKDATNGLQVKDGGITNDKLANDIKVGSLANLSTTAKSNVVESINELYNGKQNKITDSTQSSNPTDTDSLSDLNGTTNKRWTFARIWNWMKGKITSVYYPVGTVIFNTGTNPSSTFGGTWSLYATGGKALYLDSTAGTTVNEELPNPSITLANNGKKTIGTSGKGNILVCKYNSTSANAWGIDYGSKQFRVEEELGAPVETASNHSHTVTIGNSTYKSGGKVKAEGVTICAWKRTA